MRPQDLAGRLIRELRGNSGVIRRTGWGISDQVLSSLSNFAVGLLVARSVDLQTFGAFSLAFSAYLIAISVIRAFPMNPLSIRYATASGAALQHARTASTGATVAAGVAAGAGLVVAGLVTEGAFSQALLALGITLPGLLLQDSWRWVFFASGEGRLAFLNDLVWLVLELVALAIVLWTGSHSWQWLVLAWGGTACIAAAVGVVQAGVLPNPLWARAWWREHNDIAGRFIVEATARVASGQLMVYGVGLVAGLATVGAFRAGQLVFGPIQVVQYGVTLMAIPEAARALAESPARLRVTVGGFSAVLAAATAAWMAVVLLIPDAIGEAILRDAWEPARALAWPIGLTAVVATLGFGGDLGLRALAAAARSLRVTLILSILGLVFGIAGAAWGGAAGCAWALFLVTAFGAVLWWVEYHRCESAHGSSGRALSGGQRPGTATGRAGPEGLG